MKRFLKYSAIALVVLTLAPKTRHQLVKFLLLPHSKALRAVSAAVVRPRHVGSGLASESPISFARTARLS
jgi:hypothetical protein